MTFDLDKAKNITAEISIEGIDANPLNFYFRLSVNGVEYGFPGDFDGKVLTVGVPALRNVLGTEIKNGKYQAKLEAECIMEDGAGYYNLLWSGEVSLKLVPSIKANLDVDDVKPEPVKTHVIGINDEDVINEPIIEQPEPPVEDIKKPKKSLLKWK